MGARITCRWPLVQALVYSRPQEEEAQTFSELLPTTRLHSLRLSVHNVPQQTCPRAFLVAVVVVVFNNNNTCNPNSNSNNSTCNPNSSKKWLRAGAAPKPTWEVMARTTSLASRPRVSWLLLGVAPASVLVLLHHNNRYVYGWVL